MKLLRSSVMLEGITHIEDLPLDDFIKTVTNLKSKVVTEKLDGANLWFGVDETGFFTSREGKSKNAKRFYDIKDYPLVGNYNGFRAAHLALKKAEAAVKSVLSSGDLIEIEVLFGRQPNTVTYGAEDKNYIVILRAVDGTAQEKADRLSKVLHGKSVTVKPQIVTSPDGDKLEINEDAQVWQFTQVKPVDTNSVDTSPVHVLLKKMQEWLASSAENVQGMTNKEVIEANLSKVDKTQKETIKSERDRLKEVVLQKFKQPIKEYLLGTLVRKVKPFLQGEVSPDEDVGVEGVVLRDPENGEMVKIVDKDVFTAINTFNNVVRSSVAGLVRTDDQNAPIESRGGVFGQAKIRIGNLLGMKELALSSSAKKILSKFKGQDASATAKNIADNIQVTDFEAMRHKIAAILKSSIGEVDQILAQFKENSGSYKLKLKTGKEIGMSPEVMKRNLTAFAETKRDINQIISAILKSRTMPELIMSLYGRTIKSIHDTESQEDNEVKESLFKTIHNSISEEGEGGGEAADAGNPQPPATSSGDIAPVEKRMIGTRVVVKRKRNFVPKLAFAKPGSAGGPIKGSPPVTESLLKLFELDSMNNFAQFATDVPDTVASQSDIEFKQLRNNVGVGADGKPVSQTDVSNYLDKAHELNDEVDTVTFGMEMDDGSVAKLYINATQADQFEQALADMLGQEDDLEKVVNNLAQTFDIVDVEWPQSAAPAKMSDTPMDANGAPVLDPVIDLGSMDDDSMDDDAEGGLLKSINGMKNPDDIELAPGAELPPDEQGEGIPPSEDEGEEGAEGEGGLLKSIANAEDGQEPEEGGEDLGFDTTLFGDEEPAGDDQAPPGGEEGGEGGDLPPEGEEGNDEGGGDDLPPSDDDAGSDGPAVDLGDDEVPDDETQSGGDDDLGDLSDLADTDTDDDSEGDSEDKPKKKKSPKSDDTTTQESAMSSFGQQFKNKLLIEKKEAKKDDDKKVVKPADDAAEEAHEFPAALKKLMLFFPQRGEKMMVALMWSLGAPLEAMIMKKSELRDTVQSAGDMYQKDSQFRLWSGRVMDAVIKAQKTPSGPAEKDVKEAKLEDELNNVLQKVILGILDKIGLPNSIERIARLQLRNNVRDKAQLAQRDSHLRAYLKILAELLGVDAVTGIRMNEEQVQEVLEEAKKNNLGERKFETFNAWKRACKAIDSTYWLDGDQDIATANVGVKPFKRGKTVSIGQWDGAEGHIVNDVQKKLEKLKADVVPFPAKVKEALTPAANDDAMNPEAQQQNKPDTGANAWVNTVKELAIALGIPEENVKWKETQTDMIIKRKRIDIRNNAAVLHRALQLLELIKKGQ